ncbi:MAG: sulfate ABC transporter substrate-binding protein [Ancalomicrobiaceae bacterium]|nr:sulfate ABC transporter substrate-binding protein [Ancalomicrobiaceae bacterium]
MADKPFPSLEPAPREPRHGPNRRSARSAGIAGAIAAAVVALALVAPLHPARADITLLNVSYDPTREFYKDVNAAFAKEWKAKTGETVTVKSSHGGSGAQARAVIDGLQADVVTLALGGDIDAIAAKSGKLAKDWQTRLPNHSSPYTSTIVLLVRKGNPKGIKDWDDLVKPGVSVITPNPKTSGGARWNYLAAWAYASATYGGDDAKIREFLAKLFKNVPVLDTGARGATTTFAQRGLGDVLIAWENEAYLVRQEFGADQFDIVVPSLSVLAEPPVAVVDGNVDAHGTRRQAEAYLNFLYSDDGQRLAAKHHYRPIRPDVVDKALIDVFPKLKLVTIDADFGGWAKAQPTHFGDGGTFDQIYKPGQ